MDPSTIIGLIAALGLVIGGIAQGDGASGFLDYASMGIVMGGTLGAVLVTYPLNSVLQAFQVVKKCFLVRLEDQAELIVKLERLSRKARKEGLLSLQGEMSIVEDPFFRKGLQLVVDGEDAETIFSILTTEIEWIRQRHTDGRGLLESAGVYCPAFGMIGTLVGLIQMLQVLDNPDAIGPGMAVALVTTFYGSFAANIVFIPLAGKLKIRSKQECAQKELILEGLLSIHAGDNPRMMVQKLQTFLAPRERSAEAA